MITQGYRGFKEVTVGPNPWQRRAMQGTACLIHRAVGSGRQAQNLGQWRGGPFGRPSSHMLLYCTVTGILSEWVTLALLIVLVPVTVTV